MWDLFTKKVVEYDFRIKILCKLPPARSQGFGTNSLKFKGSLLWNSLIDEIKTAKRLTFPQFLKAADVSPIFKSGESTHKGNYRPISVLPALSKVFGRIMIKQIQPFANKFLSNSLCAFRNGYNSQHALFSLIETCRKTLDQKEGSWDGANGLIKGIRVPSP